MMIMLGVIVTLFESYNFRNYGINSAISKAEAIAEITKNGLTSHMVNNNMHQRNVFLNSISSMENIDKIWIIRGESVNTQFGPSLANELPKDTIDKDVLATGKMRYQLYEDTLETVLRITIPYNATNEGNINCISCHNVKYGETLGAISIKLDISDSKQIGINSIGIILMITILSVILVILFTNKILNPYLDTIEILSHRIKEASVGLFKKINEPKKLTPETGELIGEYNSLIDKLNHTFNDIDNKLKVYIGNQITSHSRNPLSDAGQIVSSLSNIFQFKKEIELDNTKEEIYHRLSEILKNQFGQYNFNFMEIDEINKKTKVVHKEGNLYFCCPEIANDPQICRVSRNSNDVVSVNYHSACPCFQSEDFLYYCIDIEIGVGTKLVINFIVRTQEELKELKKDISFIKSYVTEAAPSIEVKLLMNALKESAFKDGLTDLYNRKFLDEHIKKLAPQALREKINIGVLMLDMDHFKAVNDEYGHDIGDKVLKELARILLENVRESDLVIRYGGEEFIVLLVGVHTEEDVMTIANKIRMIVSENEIDVYAGSKLRKTVSIGFSMFPGDSKSIDTVMKNADIALYQAKDSGRNQVARFDESKEHSIEIF